MRKVQIIIFVALGLVVIGCSAPGKPQMDEAPPPPNYNANARAPQNNNGAIMLPQPNSVTQPAISESAAAVQAESQVYSRKQIIEERGPGGVVNKITVDQSGNVPNYVIYPGQMQPAQNNTNPDRISPPNWQFSW